MSQNAQGDHPGYQQDHHLTVASHLAATATEKAAAYKAQRACRLKKVEIVPRAAATGDNTNTTYINVLHGATEKSSLELATGTDLVAGTAVTLYEPATPLALAVGDVVSIQWEKVGTGLLIPELTVVVVVDFEP